MKINICYASDENYVMPLSVSLYSFLEHHQEIEQIFIHILGNKITHDSQEKIKEIALEFNRELTFYDLSEKLESIYLQNNIPNTIAITSYSRLFIDEFLPAKLEGTLLYVDCDTLFLGGIDKIIAHPQEKIIEGVKDHVSSNAKNAIGLNSDDIYINAGFLKINFQKWKEFKAIEKIYHCIKKHEGNVYHHDQGIINSVFENQIAFLPLEYNMMTSLFEFQNIDEILKFYDAKNYYSEAERLYALNNPVMIHFTPGFSKRPWVKNSKHPYRKVFWEYVSKTSFKNAKQWNDQRPFKQRAVEKIFWSLGAQSFKKIFS